MTKKTPPKVSKKQDSTKHLINMLAGDCTINKSCYCPLKRTIVWVLATTILLSGTLYIYGLRPDVFGMFLNAPYLSKTVFALATGITAALAGFCLSIPGFNKRLAIIPFVLFGLWFLAHVCGCVFDYMDGGISALSYSIPLSDLKFMMLLGLPLAGITLFLQRHSAPVFPRLSGALLALAAFSSAAAALQLHDATNSNFTQLIFYFGSTAVLVGLFYLAGRPIMSLTRNV